MKVVVIAKKLSGGAGIAAQRSFKAISAGFECDLLTEESANAELKRHGKLNNLSKGGLRKLSAMAKHLLMQFSSRKGRDPVFFLNGTLNLQELKEYQDADVVIIHWVYGWVDLRLLDWKKKHYWVCHDMAPFSQGVPYLSSCCTTAGLLIRTVNAFSMRNVDLKKFHFVFPSKWLQMEAEGRIQGIESTVIRNAIEPILEESVDLSECSGIGFLAADISNPRKGAYLLESALNGLSAKTLVKTIGSAQLAFGDTIEAQHFGYIEDPLEIASILHRCQFVVVPSLEDNLPNAAVEALCAGTPVVGFATGGIPEIVNDKSFGELAEEISVEGLRSAITRAANKSYDKAFIRKENQNRFSPELHLKMWTDLLQKI